MTEHEDTTHYAEEAFDAPAERLRFSAMAIAAFVLGLASLLLFAVPALPWLLSVLAVVFGHTGRREIKQGLKSGWGYDIGGLILGYTVLVALLVIAVAQR